MNDFWIFFQFLSHFFSQSEMVTLVREKVILPSHCPLFDVASTVQALSASSVLTCTIISAPFLKQRIVSVFPTYKYKLISSPL